MTFTMFPGQACVPGVMQLESNFSSEGSVSPFAIACFRNLSASIADLKTELILHISRNHLARTQLSVTELFAFLFSRQNVGHVTLEKRE